MKGHKIDLTPYKVEVIKVTREVCTKCQVEIGRPVMKNGEIQQEEVDFKIKQAVANIVYNKKPKDGRDFLKISRLADRIEQEKEEYIILDPNDFIIVKEAFMKIDGVNLNKNHVEMFERILEKSEEIELTEKKNGK